MNKSTAIYLRMFGYTTTILMHVGNILFLVSCMNLKVPNDAELKVFAELQPRYFTCWNFVSTYMHMYMLFLSIHGYYQQLLLTYNITITKIIYLPSYV